MSNNDHIIERGKQLSDELLKFSQEAASVQPPVTQINNVVDGIDPFIYSLSIFVLACFVGYFVVWKVTPALHTPLMALTNAISGIIIVGAIIAVGASESGSSNFLGFLAVVLASINIFGGFIVTQRMLGMFKKKGK